MKKHYIAAAILLTILSPSLSSAVTQDIDFSWTMSDTTDVIGYKMYYSDNVNMTINDATLHSDCTTPSSVLSVYTPPDLDFSMTCNNVPMDQSPVYFKIASFTATSEVDSVTFDIVFLNKVVNFKLNIAPTAEITSVSPTSGTAPLLVAFDASGSSDADGTLSSYSWDFGDSTTGSGVEVNHTYAAGSFTASLTVTDDDGAVSQPVTNAIEVAPDLSGPLYAVNFQPSNVPIPDGFQLDSGDSYNVTQGYGWTQLPASLGTRDRNSSSSLDQAYDTLIHLIPAAVWELAVNNGSYKVTICMGDPSFPTGTPNVQAEGNTIISGQALGAYNKWIEESADIQVTDGHLTISFTGSTDPAKICWIKVDTL